MSLDMIVFQGTGACNLNCSYCYLPESSRKSKELMDLDLLKRASRKLLRSSLIGGRTTILWHAGEPLTAGIQWFEKAVKIIDVENVHSRNIGHSVQTNGVLINDDWCKFFVRHQFHVGVSVDGPGFLHDLNRRNWGGRGSFAKVKSGIKALRDNGLRYSAICVLTRESIKYPDEIFQFFLDEGFTSVGFNAEEIEGFNGKSSLGETNEKGNSLRDRYTAFMGHLADLWMRNQDRISVREFEVISAKKVASLARPNFSPTQDVAEGLKILTVRLDGKLITFSPELASGDAKDPDRFVIGHIDDVEEIEDLFASEKYRNLRTEIAKGVRRCQTQCEYFGLCGGGWPSNKYFENGTFDSCDTISCVFSVKAVADALASRLFERPEFRQSVATYVGR